MTAARILLRGVAVVVLEKAAESLPALDLPAGQSNFFGRFDDLVPQSLMISFAVKMRKELANSIPQRPFAEEDHPRKAFLFQCQRQDSTDNAISVGLQIAS